MGWPLFKRGLASGYDCEQNGGSGYVAALKNCRKVFAMVDVFVDTTFVIARESMGFVFRMQCGVIDSQSMSQVVENIEIIFECPIGN